MGNFTRISKLHRDINDLAASGFMTTMRKFPLVKHPIVKTNAIGKNLDYKACHKLWNYIHSYDRVGYKVEMAKREPIISKEFERDIYNSFLWDYFMLRAYIERIEHMNIDRPKRQKEMSVKRIRQSLDEIICGLDMSDADIKKLIMNEVTNLLAKHKTEDMYADAGSGKSTLLHLLGGLDRPTGSVNLMIWYLVPGKSLIWPAVDDTENTMILSFEDLKNIIITP